MHEHELSIWTQARLQVRQRDVLGARGLLCYAAESDKPNAGMAQVMVELLTNYHGYLSQLQALESSTLTSLVPNTAAYRSLPPRMSAEVDREHERLIRTFRRASQDVHSAAAYFLHQVLYWLALTDGFRVHHWVYQGIRTIEGSAPVTPELRDFRSHVRAELLSGLDIVPREANTLTSKWSRSNYEGIEDFRKFVHSMGVQEEDVDAFLPQLDLFARLNLVTPI